MPGDYHWGWVKAGWHFAGTNGSTSFPEVRGHTVTAYGSPVISTTKSRYAGEGSLYLNGYSRLELPVSADFQIPNASLSISWSMYPTQFNPQGYDNRLINIGVNDSPYSFTIGIHSGGSWMGAYRPYGSNNSFAMPGGIAFNVWQDYELSVFNGNAFWFKNGVLMATMSGLNMPTFGTNQLVRIGHDTSDYASVNGPFYGYISNLRIMLGGGRNVASFTPDSGPFVEGLELHSIRGESPQPIVQASPPAWRSAVFQPPVAARDMEDGGIGMIIGNTKNAGSPDYPVARRVRLLRRRDGRLARETWSDAAGNFAFLNVRHDVAYVLVSHDHTGLYNGVISDPVTPELMP